MRKKIVAGNWKMNLTAEEALKLNSDVENQIMDPKCDIYQFTPSLYLPLLVEKEGYIQIGAQNGYPEKNGAFTGEISMFQLRSIGVQSVLIGHSERRQLFNETNDFLKSKVDAALENQITPFYCCGETLNERESGKHEEVVIKQITEGCFHLSAEKFRKIVFAYEPVWAIGTGKTASPEQANDMHRLIRNTIAENYDKEIAENATILYGGSCKPTNAKELFTMEHIDGGLIGGASLKADEFIQIVNTLN